MTEKHLETGKKSRYESVGPTCTWQESTKAAQNSCFSYMNMLRVMLKVIVMHCNALLVFKVMLVICNAKNVTFQVMVL